MPKISISSNQLKLQKRGGCDDPKIILTHVPGRVERILVKIRVPSLAECINLTIRIYQIISHFDNRNPVNNDSTCSLSCNDFTSSSSEIGSPGKFSN